jgi:antitoxin VapB
MRKAKVFMSGNSQAVRLPRDCQFNSHEVLIEKKGGKIILWETPKNLSNAFNLLTRLPDDFFSNGRQDLPPQERENL